MAVGSVHPNGTYPVATLFHCAFPAYGKGCGGTILSVCNYKPGYAAHLMIQTS